MKNRKKGNVLVVDDEFNAARVLSAILSQEGYRVSQFQNPQEALRMVPQVSPDLIISDLKMPGMDGMQLFERLRKRHPEIPFIFLTAFGTVETAVTAMASGAFHFFIKPPDYIKLREVVGSAIEKRRGTVRQTSWERTDTAGAQDIIIAKSPCMVNVLRIMEEVKDSSINVLITGETGTGKELIARMLHQRSYRKNNPFVTVNCAAIPPELMESELFGSEKGSYTGASSRRIGKFEEAAGGTVLLDEIGEIPLPLQAKLLRVLQEREIERIGGNKKIRVDFRLLSSTNQDLQGYVHNGTFREDLYYRINVVHIVIPSLRERAEDIPLLVNEFVREFSIREKKSLSVSDEAIRMLRDYHWPGNIRQLKNAVERVVVLTKGRILMKEEFSREFQARDRGTQDRREKLISLKELEMEAVRNSLMICNGNKSKAARLLGISRNAFYRRLDEFGIMGRMGRIGIV